MSSLTVYLFGKLQVQRGGQVLADLGSHKVQELFAYLLLHRSRYHSREALADLLWGDSTTAQSKRYLRNALWQLHSVLDSGAGAESDSMLLADPRWIRLNPEADLWLDVAEFERAFALVQGVPGHEMDAQSVQTMEDAGQLYRGDLLEGWYQDWCLFERERLQSMYLSMLEKLMAHCETHGKYEDGLAYGTHVLRYDVAHERTHRRLMRLHYLAGNRTAALRQYQRCAAALREELDVDPTERTVALYEQIRSDRLVGPGLGAPEDDERVCKETAPALSQALSLLKLLRTAFAESQRQLQQAIHAVEIALNGQSQAPPPQNGPSQTFP
jgi:DNA-binding SARP family transcriptional activator